MGLVYLFHELDIRNDDTFCSRVAILLTQTFWERQDDACCDPPCFPSLHVYELDRRDSLLDFHPRNGNLAVWGVGRVSFIHGAYGTSSMLPDKLGVHRRHLVWRAQSRSDRFWSRLLHDQLFSDKEDRQAPLPFPDVGRLHLASDLCDDHVSFQYHFQIIGKDVNRPETILSSEGKVKLKFYFLNKFMFCSFASLRAMLQGLSLLHTSRYFASIRVWVR